MASDYPFEGTQAALRAFLHSRLDLGFTALDLARSTDTSEQCQPMLDKAIDHLSIVRQLEDVVDEPLVYAAIHKRADELEFAIAYFHQRRDEKS